MTLPRLASVGVVQQDIRAGTGLAALKETAAEEAHNLMDPIIDCARARCSEGEMVQALQAVFGSYTESPVF